MKKLFFVLTCSLLSVAMMASVTVRGVVISTEDGLPVIGASVLEKVHQTVQLPILMVCMN